MNKKRIKEYEDSIVVTSKKISCGGVAVAIMEVAESSFKWLRWWLLNMFWIVFAHTKKSLKLKQPHEYVPENLLTAFRCKTPSDDVLLLCVGQSINIAYVSCMRAVLLDDAYFKGYVIQRNLD